MFIKANVLTDIAVAIGRKPIATAKQ